MVETGQGMSGIVVIEQRGSHLLVACGDRFAVLERRGGRIYDVRGGRREFDDTPMGMAAAVGDGWTDEGAARRLFDEAARRGDDLAERLW
jgi:hypothetical protein